MNPSVSRTPLRLPLPKRGAPCWLRLGTVFDGHEVLTDAHLVYDAKRILHVGGPPPSYVVGADRTEPDLHLPHHTALPGLIEAHAHLFLEGGELDPARRATYLGLHETELLARAESRLPRLVRLGVLAVRDAGDRNGVGLALQRRDLSSSRGEMPYLDSPGAALHHQGRYGSFMGETIESFGTIEQAIAARVAAEAHRIKLLATGIINFEKGAVTTKPQMSVEELTRAVTAAHTLGRETMIHCSGNDGVQNCIAARVDTIEHGFFIDRDQLARLRDLNIAWIPTFAPVHFQWEHGTALGWSELVRSNLRRILDDHAARLREAGELGVRIIAGSDAGSHGVPHGYGFFTELEIMEAAGLSTLQVLRSATGASAGRLGLREDQGRLRIGARSRFLLTDAPVLQGVRHLRQPLTVVFDHAVFSGGDVSTKPGL